jgi:transcriptional regulator with XRE-family HTH domain
VEDFGKTLHRLREERGISLRKLASLSGVDHSNIGRAEKGQGGLSEQSVTYLDSALRADGELVEAYGASSGHEGRRGPARRGARHDPEDLVRRRILIQQAVTALAAGTAGPALNAIRHGLVSSVTGREPGDLDVDEWEQIAHDYGVAYFTEQPAALIHNLAAELADLQGELNLVPDEEDIVHKGLSRSAALLAAVMAMSLVNVGEFQQSRLWWRAARQTADASRDPAVRIWVRGHDAMHALYDHRPLRAALARAGEALAIGGTTAYSGSGEALGAQAQTLALFGRADEARTAVNQLADLYERLPGDVTQDQGTIYGYPETRMWHSTSYVHTYLGDTAPARAAQESALALYPIGRVRARAQVQLHTARCLVLDGHLDDGANHALAVIDAVPPEHRTAMVLGVGHKVYNAVPSSERTRPPVAGLREILALPAGTAAQ